MSFLDKLHNAWIQQDSLLCVGIDPVPDRLPTCLQGDDRIYDFCRSIIDETAPYACAYKPQIACFAAARAEETLERVIDHIQQNHPEIPVILDAKRGDIPAMATMYAREAFERYDADAVTVNPYLGGDSLKPFLEYADRGVIILCRTSNPGSDEFQSFIGESSGEALSLQVARKAAQMWNHDGNVALVVGATWPEELARVRDVVGGMPLLIPGIGTQGGNLTKVLKAGIGSDGLGLVINVSRSILYADGSEDFAITAGKKAAGFCKSINQIRKELLPE